MLKTSFMATASKSEKNIIGQGVNHHCHHHCYLHHHHCHQHDHHQDHCHQVGGEGRQLVDRSWAHYTGEITSSAYSKRKQVHYRHHPQHHHHPLHHHRYIHHHRCLRHQRCLRHHHCLCHHRHCTEEITIS